MWHEMCPRDMLDLLDEHYFHYMEDFFGLSKEFSTPYDLLTYFEQKNPQDVMRFIAANEKELDDPCVVRGSSYLFLLQGAEKPGCEQVQIGAAGAFGNQGGDPSGGGSGSGRKKREAFEPCNEGFMLDDSTGYCYKVVDVGQSAYEGEQICSWKHTGAEFLKFNKDKEVEGFIKLAKNGLLKDGQEFFISAWRNKDGKFAMDSKFLAIEDNLDNDIFKVIDSTNGRSKTRST